jgi:hypothetical protein
MSDVTVRVPRPKGLLVPATLIGLGVLFLASNLGYLPPISLRALLNLWPVLLIVFGIEALVGRRQPWLALALEALVIAAAVALAAAQPLGLLGPPASGPAEQIVARNGTSALSLRVSGGAGDYRISGGAAALVEARTERGPVRARTTKRDGGTTEVRVEPGDGQGGAALFGDMPRGVSVKVASDVPTALRVEGGAGEFTLDLREIQVTDVRVGTGASQTRIVLPTPRGDIPVRIEAGAASIEIEVPAGVEARVSARGGAVSVNSANARLAISGGAGETAGYATARDRVTVTFEGGAASVTIR